MTIQPNHEQQKAFKEFKRKQKEVFENTSKERLMAIAFKMHLWIFKHCINEQEIYDELGLTDEENFLFGYGGQFIITNENGDEE